MELGVALAIVNFVVLCILVVLVLAYITTIAEYRRLMKRIDHATNKSASPHK